MLLVLFVCVIVIIYYVYFRWSRKAIYDFSETLPDVGSLPVLGHTHWFIGGPERLLNNIKQLGSLFDKSPSTINKVWIGPSLYIVPFNPEDIQKILDNCLQKDSSYRFLQAWLGNGLFVAPVELWKMHRKLLLTVFHNRIIEDYIDIFGEQGTFLVKRLRENVGQHEFDVFKYVTSCTLDIVFANLLHDIYRPLAVRISPGHVHLRDESTLIIETAMGKKMDVQNNPDTPYLRARNVVMSIISMRLFKAWLQPEALFNMTSYSKIQKENIDYTHKFTDEVVTEKRASFNKNGMDTKGRKDLLELLLERNANFTDEELREHIDSITIAGNDTTALVISYVLLILGSHNREQDIVYAELQSIFGDSMRSPTKEDLNKMEYLERVIKETMRLYTVVPIIGRETQKELKLSTCTVPAGVGCAILPFILHRSKKIWGPDAEDFNPDRFLPENSVNRHPCSFIPFSYGARNCIGRHFGMLGMKSILANVLRSYKMSSNICNRLKIEILLIPVSGHLITIEKRI